MGKRPAKGSGGGGVASVAPGVKGDSTMVTMGDGYGFQWSSSLSPLDHSKLELCPLRTSL